MTLDGEAVTFLNLVKSGSTVTVELWPFLSSTSGTLVITYVQPSSTGWADLATNKVENFTATATFAPQQAPQFVSGAIAANGTELTLTFDEKLAYSATATSAFTVTVGASPVDVSSVQVSSQAPVKNERVTLTLASPVLGTDTGVEVSYTVPDSDRIQDVAGNQAASFTDQAVANNSTQVPDVTPPLLGGGLIPPSGIQLELGFNETLAAAVPATSAFTVTVSGSPVAVSSVTNTGATSALTLASTVLQTDTGVRVSYDAPASGGLQDAAGNLVVDFTDQSVMNNATVSGGSGGSSEFSVPAAPPAPPVPADSTATVDTGESTDSETTPETVVTTPTLNPETPSTSPTRVNEENQAALTTAAGEATMLINGEEVELTLTSTGADEAGAVAPEQRSAEQVVELQEAADGLVERLDAAAGGDSGLEVVDTDTGAEIDGIFDDTRVPVEDVIVAEAAAFTGLYASRDENGNPNQIRAEILEMERGGQVAVFVYGIPAGEDAELVLMSTPFLLGTATADADGNFTRVLSPPEATLAGDHTLVTATDTVTVTLGIRITDPAAADAGVDEVTTVQLPATGGEVPVAPALFIIGLGGLLLAYNRRRELFGH